MKTNLQKYWLPRLFAFLSVIAVAASLISCKRNEQPLTPPQKIEPQPTIQVSIGFRPTVVVDLALLQAVGRGDFKKAGIEVTLKPYGRADLLFAALKSGEIQGSAGIPLEPVLGMAAAGQYPYRSYLIWYFDASNPYDGFIVKSDSPVKTLADLDGKIVGSHPSKQVKYFVSKIIPGATIQEYNPATPLLSVKSGDQAAAYVLEPVISLALASGDYRLIEPGAISKDVFGGARVPAAVSVLSAKWIEDHSKEAALFVQIARDAYLADIKQRDTNAVISLLSSKEYGGFSSNVAVHVVEPASSLPEDLDRARFQQFLGTLRDGKLLDGDVDIEKLLYSPPPK